MGLQRAMHARTLICMGMRRNWDRPHDPKPIIARKGSALLANAHEDFARAMPRVNRLSGQIGLPGYWLQVRPLQYCGNEVDRRN